MTDSKVTPLHFAADKRGEISKSVQCNEMICGDVENQTERGGQVYTTITRPRTVGLRLGRIF